MKAGWKDRVTGPAAFVEPEFGTPTTIHAYCGSPSNGLTILDFDLKNASGEDIFTDFMNLLKSDFPKIEASLPYFSTVSGGYKIPFFSGTPITSQVLAKHECGNQYKPVIEIQGEKSLSIIPPSEGYQWIRGGLDSIPFLMDEEIGYLTDLAKCFNEQPEVEVPVYEPKGVRIAGDSPLNKFDEKTNFAEWMTSLGWRVIKVNSGHIHLNRPGAKHKNRVDATIYRGNNVLKFHSTSQELVPDTDRGYRPSQLLVFTKYNGDFSAAARELALEYKLELPSPQPGAAILKQPIRPVKGKEDKLIPNNLAQELKERVDFERVRIFAQDNLRRGVSLSEDFFLNACDVFNQLDPNEVRRFITEFYEQNQEEFGDETRKFSSFELLEKYIKKNFVVRRNTVSFTTEILDKEGNPTKNNIDSIWNALKRQGVRIQRGDIVGFFNDPNCFSEYDPFEEYFTSLEFKGEGFIRDLANHVIVPYEAKDFWQKMFRKALIRTVAAAVGEYPNRDCIVLCSEKERLGKTQFIRFLSPWGVKKYFSDEPIIQNKDQMFRIAQNLIYLVDEIDTKTTNQKTSDYMKMLISKSSVNDRRLYDVDTTVMTRKVTFWGTTNKRYLNKGENSRYISIPVVAVNHDYSNFKTKQATIDINDVWAEAYNAYINGEEFELDYDDMEMAAKLNQDWRLDTEAEGLVRSYISGDSFEWLSAEQILNTMSTFNPTISRRINTKELRDALQLAGIQHRYDKNELGYRVHLYKCRIKEAGPTSLNDEIC
jgi:hypothetical protein